MANTYKNIVITPNIGNTSDPKIQFSGANSSANTDITLYVYPTSNGTLSFEGSAGQLFSITNDLSNSLFAVSDVSGIPSLEVFANSLVSVAPLGGNVVIGNTAKLIISSGTGVYANDSLGTAGQILRSNGSSVYWDADAGGVTSLATGNGMTGGPVTTTGTVSVLANTGIVANATGVYVNATYIGTLSANNSTYLNGQLAAYYTNATNITTGTLPYAQIPANIANTTGAFTFSGVHTHSANVILGSSGLSANGGFGTAGQVLHTNGTATYWATDDVGTGTVTSVATGNGLTGGPVTTTGTVSVLANSGIVANTTGVFVNAQTPLSANATGLWMATSAGNGTFSSGISAITVDSYGRVTSVTGSAGYVTSAGVTSVATGNGMTGGPITGTGTVSILANTGISANSTGVFVVAGNGIITNSTGVHVGSGNGINTTTTTTYVVQGTGVVVNATGVHVNATYISTLAANSANYLGTVAAASYIVNTDSRTLSGNLILSGANTTVNANFRVVNSTANVLFVAANGNVGISGNVTPAHDLRVEGTTSLAGAVSGITTLAAGNTTLTGFLNVSTTATVTGDATFSGNVGVGAAASSVATLFSSTSFAVDASLYNVNINTGDANVTTATARSKYALVSSFGNLNQNKDAGGNSYGSAYYGIYSDLLNGSSTTGGNAYAGYLCSGYFRALNYANGAGANTVDSTYGVFGGTYTAGSGNITTAYGLYGTITATTATANGNIAAGHGVYSTVSPGNLQTITTGYLYRGVYAGNTAGVTGVRYGVHIAGEESNYFSNTIQVGTANVITTATITTYGGLESGTKSIFQQTAAPTGWTKDTTHNNKALRIVSGTVGTGGTVAFTTAFASQAVSGTVGSTTLDTTMIPSHTHSYSFGTATNTTQTGTGARLTSASGGAGTASSSSGGGLGHTHTFTGTAINLAVQYVDFIIATKD